MHTTQDAINTVDTEYLFILSNENQDSIKIGKNEIQIHSIPDWLLD